ncbi:hypothetical protein [Chromobacterium violaceum]|uniref:hypothetical protein n=1 Tax=Chromobacterium violaceum TaxID=536 RepID=UPI001C8C3BA2|nr:hypothetical protein [Chromobacterium violaceum]MBX9267252.1 hypothetical protein [Chromobacterium violaceum]
MEHSTEPWIVPVPIVADAVLPYAPLFATTLIGKIYSTSFGDHAQAEANARRIAACVNACKGLSTELLENISDVMGDTLKSRIDALRKAANERDKLQQDYDAQALALKAAKAMQQSETERADKAEALNQQLLEALSSLYGSMDSFWGKSQHGGATYPSFFDMEMSKARAAIRAANAEPAPNKEPVLAGYGKNAVDGHSGNGGGLA